MGRVFPVVCALLPGLATGCAQLVGIDETSNSGRTNSATLTRVSIGATVATHPLDLGGQSASYFELSGGKLSRVAAGLGDAPGTWTARLPDPAPIEVTRPDRPEPSQFDLGVPQTQLPIEVFEHPDPVPAGADATIALDVMLDQATAENDTVEAYAIGPWALRAFTATELPVGSTAVALTYPYNTSTSALADGRTQFDAITTDDVFTVLHYTGTALKGVAIAPPFAQTGADTVAVPMVALTADLPVETRIDTATVAARYTSVLPAVSTLNMAWSVIAAPAYQRAVPFGPVLLFDVLKNDAPGVSAIYANPFLDRGWHALFTLATVENRAFTLPDAPVGILLSASMQQYVEPTADPITLNLPAGLPTRISLGGVQLTADGQTIATPADVLEVSFSTDNANATLYAIDVIDLVLADDQSHFDRRIVYHAEGKDPAFQLPPELFVAQHSYTIQATTKFGGYPNIDSGDLVTRELPFAQSSLDSAVFTVTP